MGTSTVQQAEHQGSPRLPANLSKSFHSFSDDWMQDIFMAARDATEGLRWWRTTKRDCKPLWCLGNFRRCLENLVRAPRALAGSGRARLSAAPAALPQQCHYDKCFSFLSKRYSRAAASTMSQWNWGSHCQE